MDRNQDQDHPVDPALPPIAPPAAPVGTQSPATAQTPAAQTPAAAQTPVATQPPSPHVYISPTATGSVSTPMPVPTPFTQAAVASNTVPSQLEPPHPTSAPTSPPPPALGSGVAAESTARPTSAPILISGDPASPAAGPGSYQAHAERQGPETNVPVPGPTAGGSQPGSLHRNRDPARQTTLSIEKLPLDDAETLPGSQYGINSPRRRGSQANPLPPLPHEIRIGRPAMRNNSLRPRSAIDYIVPNTMDEKIYREKTVQERLTPTLNMAMAERDKYARKAKMTGYALNIAIGLQVLLGALTTGLSAVTTGHQTSIMTAILGGLATVVASYLARARGSNEPELSITRVKDLEQFIRECEAFQMDRGHILGDKYDNELETFRRRFEELLGNSNGERRLAPPV